MATKNRKREALHLLKSFQVAGELSTTADITIIKEAEPRPSTKLLILRFIKTQYVAVFDDALDDDTTAALELIHQQLPGLSGHFVKNPHEDSFETYGVRHKFRETYLFEVKPVTVRLDVELSKRYPELSRATVQKYIKAGFVSVDGDVQKKSSKDVSSASDIAMTLPISEDHTDKSFPIIYIDDYVIVINKPAGVLTHSKGVMNDEFTVADFFRRYSSHALLTNRPGIVHRLDRDTSGVIIGARTDEAADMLKKQFAQRTVKKTYEAVVSGVPKHETAMIDVPIGRNPSAPSTFRADPNGKPALTSYILEKTNGIRSLIELRPKTGRTHQLRVHMQYIGTPIYGDKVYGSHTASSLPERMYLHAKQLEITLPHGKREVFEATVPAVFTEAVS